LSEETEGESPEREIFARKQLFDDLIDFRTKDEEIVSRTVLKQVFIVWSAMTSHEDYSRDEEGVEEEKRALGGEGERANGALDDGGDGKGDGDATRVGRAEGGDACAPEVDVIWVLLRESGVEGVQRLAEILAVNLTPFSATQEESREEKGESLRTEKSDVRGNGSQWEGSHRWVGARVESVENEGFDWFAFWRQM
jgi:hypothetical protein